MSESEIKIERYAVRLPQMLLTQMTNQARNNDRSLNAQFERYIFDGVEAVDRLSSQNEVLNKSNVWSTDNNDASIVLRIDAGLLFNLKRVAKRNKVSANELVRVFCVRGMEVDDLLDEHHRQLIVEKLSA